MLGAIITNFIQQVDRGKCELEHFKRPRSYGPKRALPDWRYSVKTPLGTPILTKPLKSGFFIDSTSILPCLWVQSVGTKAE